MGPPRDWITDECYNRISSGRTFAIDEDRRPGWEPILDAR